MKRKRNILIVALILLSVLACGESTPSVRTKRPIIDTSEPIQEAAEVPEEATRIPIEATEIPPENTQPPVGTSRSNPAPLGAEVDVGDMTMVVGEVIRPADDIIEEANSFNSDPEAGNEYILVSVGLACNKGSDEECSYFTSEFNLVGSTGVTREPEIFIAGLDGMLESGEMFGGAKTGGMIAFQVGIGETDLILIYEELFGSKIFLALSE